MILTKLKQIVVAAAFLFANSAIAAEYAPTPPAEQVSSNMRVIERDVRAASVRVTDRKSVV